MDYSKFPKPVRPIDYLNELKNLVGEDVLPAVLEIIEELFDGVCGIDDVYEQVDILQDKINDLYDEMDKLSGIFNSIQGAIEEVKP